MRRNLLLFFALSLAVRALTPLEPQGGSGPTVIVPGKSVGLLQLGDTRERAFELFPRKPNMDQEWQEGGGCGTTINWLDKKRQTVVGNVFIRIRNGRAFQIDSRTPSFQTSEGITIRSSPQEIRKTYSGLRAYILSEGFSGASGGYPLIYWIDAERGIAFAFGQSRKDQKPYLDSISVFEAHAEVCPQYPPLEPSDKRELTPYSLKAD